MRQKIITKFFGVFNNVLPERLNFFIYANGLKRSYIEYLAIDY